MILLSDTLQKLKLFMPPPLLRLERGPLLPEALTLTELSPPPDITIEEDAVGVGGVTDSSWCGSWFDDGSSLDAGNDIERRETSPKGGAE